MQRYFTNSGSHPEETKACFHMSGPQSEEHIPEGVKLLLSMKGITQVDVRYNYGLGDRIEVYRKMEE